jgi:hypothetical protein
VGPRPPPPKPCPARPRAPSPSPYPFHAAPEGGMATSRLALFRASYLPRTLPTEHGNGYAGTQTPKLRPITSKPDPPASSQHPNPQARAARPLA